MSNKSISIEKFKEMIIAGSKQIADNHEKINELNVFPVPDGDTGDNMMITTQGAVDVIKNETYADLFSFGKTYARALLMNARGNSGVIFSQIIKGFVSIFEVGDKTIEIDELVRAFVEAKKIAYNAVSNPVEGTILTVIRSISEYLNPRIKKYASIEAVLQDAVAEGEKALAKTPEMLPALKEANVVDSGGYGLMCFIIGMRDSFSMTETAAAKQEKKSLNKKSSSANLNITTDNHDGFGYCTEFIMTIGSKVISTQANKEDFNFTQFKKDINKMGNSGVIVIDDDLVKVHVHTIAPYSVLSYASRFGEFNKIKVENMTLQYLANNPGLTLEMLTKAHESHKKEFTNKVRIVATVPSPELVKYYKDEFDITETINTENTGNPSIKEIVRAIESTNAKNVIVVLDDSNIFLAAEGAKNLLKNKINIEIVNARNIVASYVSCLNFDEDISMANNIKNITKAIGLLDVVEFSKSIKSLKTNGVTV
jgi:DAK2 domain fusion protein YloV